MRKFVVLALSVAMVLGLFVVPAAAAASNGCKGIENALTKANATGKRALEVVAEKHGCGGTTPPPVDAMACPAGTSTLSEWKYSGYYDSTPDAYGYGTWIDTPGWQLVGTLTGVMLDNTGDAGGFWYFPADGVTVQNYVLKGFSGEIVTRVPDADNSISTNELVTRTEGIESVRFCG